MYNIEIQTANQYDLERRSRYYQQKIDAQTLRKGAYYKDLPDSYVIFVCTFDYFHRGLAAYKKKSVIEDCADVEYNDGSHVIFLNSKFSVNNVSTDICEFLQFLQSNDSDAPYQSELAREVISAVNEVRNDTSREGIYMTLAMKLEEARRAGQEEARKQGQVEGQLLVLREIMKNLGLSAQKALDALGIPEANQPEYLAALEKNNISQ